MCQNVSDGNELGGLNRAVTLAGEIVFPPWGLNLMAGDVVQRGVR